jgi:hypothetical protein
MSSPAFPANWSVCGAASADSIYEEPKQPKDKKRLRMYGMLENDGYKTFEMPADTKASAIVRYFRVGSHGAINSGADPEGLITRVAAVADKITKIVPARPFFADEAGLKLKFLKKVTKADLKKIEALFPEDNMLELGLERYVSDWDGESGMLDSVIKEGLFHFWWD